MHFLNANDGQMSALDARYFNFLDSMLVPHESVTQAIKLCKPYYEYLDDYDYPYVLHRSGKQTKTEGGEFYLTTTGMNIISRADLGIFPPLVAVEDKKQKIKQSDIDDLDDEPKPKAKKTEPKTVWTRDKVVELMTTEAHVVGRMLGHGYNLLEPIHGEWIKEWLLNPSSFKIMVHQAHRGSYKSTCLRLAVAIFMILNPLTTIIVLRKSEDAVKELVMGVSKILDTPLFHTFINILYPDINARGGFKKTTDTALAIDTNLNVNLSGEYQLRALGLGSPLTGKHAEFIITDDICFVAGTKIATPLGDKNIEDLKVGDLVITPFGYKKITKTHNREAEVITNCGLTGTYNHPVYNKTKNSFDFLVHVCNNDLSRLNLKELVRWTTIKTLLSGMGELGKEQVESILSSERLTDKELAKCCIGLCGKNTMEKFQRVTSFTIKTIIHLIMTLAIYNVYLLGNIKECTLLRGLNGLVKILEKRHSQHKESGLKQKKVLLFAEKISRKLKKNVKNTLKPLYARFVEKSTQRTLENQLECVEFVEKENPLEDLKKKEKQSEKQMQNMYLSNARVVEKNTGHALQPEIKMGCVKDAQTKKEQERKSLQTVYNIEVEDEHVYYANGVLVHNCTTEDRISEAARMETIAKYQELMNILSTNKSFSNSRILNIGTPWHEEDAFSLMEKGLRPKIDIQVKLENIPYKKRTERQNEKIRFANMKRGLFVYNCYQTGLMTDEDIEWQKKVLNDDVLFAANYLLTLVSDDEKPFPKINNVGNYSKSFFAKSWEVFATIDAAYGGTDSCSLSIGAHDWESNNTIVYGKLYSVALDKNYLELAEEMWSCGVQTLFMENNADKGLMGDKFREIGFNVVGYHESMNKHTKIVSSIRPFWREKSDGVVPCVQFVKETDKDYLAQIHNYKKGVRHDDAPDNLACLLLKSKFGSLSVRVS